MLTLDFVKNLELHASGQKLNKRGSKVHPEDAEMELEPR